MEVAEREPEPINHTDRLPAELKCTITRHVRGITHRKALVLVNKAWSEVALPFLWETLTTDLVQKDQRHLIGIAHPDSNIVRHIRNISLLDRSISVSDDHLPKLLAVIPRNQLREFKSATLIQQSTIELLLMLHSNLEVLELPTDSNLAGVVNSLWTSGCLSSLKSIKIDVCSFSSQAIQKLWAECANLLHLDLESRAQGSMGSILHEDAFRSGSEQELPSSSPQNKTVSILPRAGALELESLRISKITLPKLLDSMFQRIDILALHELTLQRFVGAGDLLDSMASSFAEGTPSLKRLRIINFGEQATGDFVVSLFSFLTSFCGLEELSLHCANCHKLDVNGVAFHGETLKILHLVNGGIHRRDRSRCVDPSDLMKIAASCQQLDQLSLNIYELETDRNNSDFLGPRPGIPFEPSEFEQAISAIASMSKLRRLQLTNLPDYRASYNRPGEFYRWFLRSLEKGQERYRFQARADGLMRYLAQQGSKIEYLMFSPLDDLRRADHADINGHVWPEYVYSRGTRVDNQGSEVAVAVPTARFED
jgi:hypothetical protein